MTHIMRIDELQSFTSSSETDNLIKLEDIETNISDWVWLAKEGKRSKTFESNMRKRMFDVYFDYDSHDIICIVFYDKTTNPNYRNPKVLKVDGDSISLEDVIEEIKVQMGY